MKTPLNKWIGRRNKQTGYIEVVCFEDAISRKPKGWKLLGYAHTMSRIQAKALAEELIPR